MKALIWVSGWKDEDKEDRLALEDMGFVDLPIRPEIGDAFWFKNGETELRANVTSVTFVIHKEGQPPGEGSATLLVSARLKKNAIAPSVDFDSMQIPQGESFVCAACLQPFSPKRGRKKPQAGRRAFCDECGPSARFKHR